MNRYEDNTKYSKHDRRPSCWQIAKTSSKLRVALVLLCGILVGLAVPTILERFLWNKNKNIRLECQLPPAFRLNALSRHGSETESWSQERMKEQCLAERSCNNPSGKEKNSAQGAPPCYHPHPANFFYTVTEKTECSEHDHTGFNLYATMTKPVHLGKNKTVETMRLRIDEMEDHRVFIRVFNGDSPTDFSPYDFLGYKSRESSNATRCDRPERLYDISPEPEVNGRMFVAVKRRGGPSIFNTNFGAQIMEEQYMELTTVLPSANVYGLGEGGHTTLRHDMERSMNWSLFAGQDERWGHGVHPFYLCVEEDGRAHGVLLEHSNALEITMRRVPSITYKTIGSSMAFHILMGPTPKDVIRQLTDLVGRPSMPPYWALGHHVCRNGETDPHASVKALREKKVPHESDCYNDNLSLRSHKTPWENITDFQELLSNHSQKLILVQVPHVRRDEADVNDSYVFLKETSEDDAQAVVGRLSDTEVMYPNYFKNLVSWSQDRLNRSLKAAGVQFDGYLLTNNTPVYEREHFYVCNQNNLNFPTFVPGKSSLWNKTLCLDACHGQSQVPCNSLRDMNHYNLHNLYGYQHTKTVSEAINGMDEHKATRPFLVSLSTFTGSGQYGGHFSVGMNSTWNDMKISLVNALEFNLYGVPLVGSPVCGYHFRKDRDLCSRWAQLAAFQPLLLSYHHFFDEKNFVTPVLMDDFVASIAAASFQLRYSFLPYLYTQFYNASIDGTPVMRPLFLEFPEDPNTWGIDEQFLWGAAVMISPVMQNSTTKFTAYFPAGIWYDFYEGDTVYQGAHGSYRNLTAIEYHVNIHLKGGHIVATQKQAIYIEDVRRSSYKIRVALEPATEDKDAFAEGQLYIDDGISKDGPSCLIKMNVQKNNLTMVPHFSKGTKKDIQNLPYNLFVDSIYILGLKSSTPQYLCSLNGKQTTCSPNEEHGTLTFRKIEVNLLVPNYITWTDLET